MLRQLATHTYHEKFARRLTLYLKSNLPSLGKMAMQMTPSLAEQRVQDGLLHVHAIFRLVEHHGLRSIENFGRDFVIAVRRKTVQK
jgi:hypothetical protein